MSSSDNILQRLKASLDIKIPSPLYIQLDNCLREAIEEGLLNRGDALPAERVIAKKLGVSRVTVRKTIERLERSGFCTRKPGAGTFVTGSASAEGGTILPQSLSALHGFSEDMISRGFKPGSQLIESKTTTPNAEEMFSLNLKQELVLRLTRVRTADKTPMALEVCCIPVNVLPPGLERDFAIDSVYAAMNKTAHAPVRATQRISARTLNQEQASLLDTTEGAPALYIKRAAYDANDQPVEYTCSYYRADRFDFVAQLVSK